MYKPFSSTMYELNHFPYEYHEVGSRACSQNYDLLLSAVPGQSIM